MSEEKTYGSLEEWFEDNREWAMNVARGTTEERRRIIRELEAERDIRPPAPHERRPPEEGKGG